MAAHRMHRFTAMGNRLDDVETCRMEAVDLRLLVEVGATRPTQRMLAHTVQRALEEPDIFEVDTRPSLYVIHTPPEVREQWQAWLRIRRTLFVCLAIIAALVTFAALV